MNPPDPTPVDRCVCMDVTFEEMIRLHKQGLDYEQIQRRTLCGTRCGMCIPYSRVAIKTGRARLAVMEGQGGAG